MAPNIGKVGSRLLKCRIPVEDVALQRRKREVTEKKKRKEAGREGRRSLLAELKVCSSKRDLERGKQIHAEALASGEFGIYVATALVNMYARCGTMVEARRSFDNIKQPDVVSWNSLISGYAENGEGVIALGLFTMMKLRGVAPNSITYVAALKACASIALDQDKEKCREWGKQIHAEVGDHSNTYVHNTLIDMYGKCGWMSEARRVFDSIKHPDVVSWTSLIMGYAENGEGITALNMFEEMKTQECAPNSITFVAALKACTSLTLAQNGSRRAECREWGKRIHSEIDCLSDIYVQSTLTDMYAKCGSMVDARLVFEGIKHPNVVSWNALIMGYAENGEGLTALDLFTRMKSQGCPPNSVTFIAALKACTSVALEQDEVGKTECKERGKQIHSEIGLHLNIYVQCTLIDMYSKCRSMADAHQAFDGIKYPDLVSWNALILGYAENEEGITALDLFERMSCAPNSITFIAALKACTSLALEQDGSGKEECRERGKQIHSKIGCHSNTYIQNTLIDMYAKCGCMLDARQIFDSIKLPDVVSWNALISGYAENRECVIALDLFARMRSQGCAPNSITFVAAVKACGSLGALEAGSKIHARIHAQIYSGTERNATILINCLVDFYAKCGSLVEAQKVFDSHPRTRNLITWNALLSGYSRLGDNKAVFGLLERMQDAGFNPDGVTFLCILTCCSHAGLVEKANEFFEAMSANYGITPSVEHYNCMVDILGRSNKLDDAIALFRSMPCRPDSVTCMTVLDKYVSMNDHCTLSLSLDGS